MLRKAIMFFHILQCYISIKEVRYFDTKVMKNLYHQVLFLQNKMLDENIESKIMVTVHAHFEVI